jgi:hypothetical protein
VILYDLKKQIKWRAYMHKKILLGLLLALPIPMYSLKIDRAIVSTDTNATYFDFWPIVAQAWKKMGIKPTLALIAPKDVKIDESIGDVIRFEPIPGIPSSFQAQVIRLLLPIYFEDEVSLISDIDMLPLSKEYYCDSVKHVSDNCFVIYRDQAYKRENYPLYPMCYNAAKGKVFKELFNIKSKDDIRNKIIEWYGLGFGWTTDERMLFKHVQEWSKSKKRIVKLGHEVEKRIDRSDWNYDKELVKKRYYIDSHMVRPYTKYKKEIDELAACCS